MKSITIDTVIGIVQQQYSTWLVVYWNDAAPRGGGDFLNMRLRRTVCEAFTIFWQNPLDRHYD